MGDAAFVVLNARQPGGNRARDLTASEAHDSMATKATATGTHKRRIRKVFGDIHEVVQMPNLIEVQRESY